MKRKEDKIRAESKPAVKLARKSWDGSRDQAGTTGMPADTVFGPGMAGPAAFRLLRLQRMHGNTFVRRLMEAPRGEAVQASFPAASRSIQRHGDHETLTDAATKYTHTLEHAGTTEAAWERGLVARATFLGMAIDRGIHQELVNRLARAETYLRGQYPGVADADIATRIGLYSISGRRPPGEATDGSKVSWHAFGLAIDVNYRGNPFIVRRTRRVGRRRTVPVNEIIKRATELVLGRTIDVRALPGSLSLVDLRTSYQEASDALRQYFSFRNDRNALQAHLQTRGLPATTDDVDRWLRQITDDYNDPDLRAEFATTNPRAPRDPAAGFIDLSEDLVVALGTHAGLLWGGQYGGGKDIMHFDWRRGTIRESDRV